MQFFFFFFANNEKKHTIAKVKKWIWLKALFFTFYRYPDTVIVHHFGHNNHAMKIWCCGSPKMYKLNSLDYFWVTFWYHCCWQIDHKMRTNNRSQNSDLTVWLLSIKLNKIYPEALLGRLKRDKHLKMSIILMRCIQKVGEILLFMIFWWIKCLTFKFLLGNCKVQTQTRAFTLFSSTAW